MTGRKRLELDERRTQLLALGREMFAVHSYDEVSIDEVAQRAGISKGLLYHYFSSKRKFYTAIVQEAAQELMNYITPDPGLDGVAQVEQGLDRYLTYVEANRTGFTCLMRGGIGADGEVHEIVERAREHMVQLVLQRSGTGSDAPLRDVALRGWVGFVEAASLAWVARGDVSREQVRGVCIQLLLQTVAVSQTSG